GLTDFENCMGIIEEDYAEACRKAQEMFPTMKKIATTHRNAISSSHNSLEAVLWNGEELLRSKHYDMHDIIDRVGGGDAFMAGLICGLLHMGVQAAPELAAASSVLQHSITR